MKKIPFLAAHSLSAMMITLLLVSGCGPVRHETTVINPPNKIIVQPEHEFEVGTLTLRDVLTSAPALAAHKPSLFVARICGNIIRIKGQEYEVRLFFFEQSKPVLPVDITFGEFVNRYNLLPTLSKVFPKQGIPVEFFKESEELSKQGVHYMLSLRKVITVPPVGI